jgi:hypothetical protein
MNNSLELLQTHLNPSQIHKSLKGNFLFPFLFQSRQPAHPLFSLPPFSRWLSSPFSPFSRRPSQAPSLPRPLGPSSRCPTRPSASPASRPSSSLRLARPNRGDGRAAGLLALLLPLAHLARGPPASLPTPRPKSRPVLPASRTPLQP